MGAVELVLAWKPTRDRDAWIQLNGVKEGRSYTVVLTISEVTEILRDSLSSDDLKHRSSAKGWSLPLS